MRNRDAEKLEFLKFIMENPEHLHLVEIDIRALQQFLKDRFNKARKQVSLYAGDDEYCIDCKDDALIGDEIRFDRPLFGGSFKKPKLMGYELTTATIMRELNVHDKQDHLFVLALEDGTELRIKGRTLYFNGVWRKPWINENGRNLARTERHAQNNQVHIARAIPLLPNGEVDLPW